MGIIRTQLKLSNPRDSELKPLMVTALVDSGALHLCVPQHIALQLNLSELYKREVATKDGKKHLCPYVGPIEIRFKNRACFTGALVLGDEVLLGAVPMEDMDLLISPAHQSLIVNPQSPNIAASLAKGLKA